MCVDPQEWICQIESQNCNSISGNRTPFSLPSNRKTFHDKKMVLCVHLLLSNLSCVGWRAGAKFCSFKLVYWVDVVSTKHTHVKNTEDMSSIYNNMINPVMGLPNGRRENSLVWIILCWSLVLKTTILWYFVIAAGANESHPSWHRPSLLARPWRKSTIFCINTASGETYLLGGWLLMLVDEVSLISSYFLIDRNITAGYLIKEKWTTGKMETYSLNIWRAWL